MRKKYIQQKGYKFIEMWECEWWSFFKTDAPVKSYLRANFPYKRPLSEEQLLQGITVGRFFGYVQCDIEVPEHLRAYFSYFPPIFKNTVVSRNDIGDLMEEYAEEEGFMPQPRRMLISSFILTNATIITPLLLFYLKLGLFCGKNSPVCSIHSQKVLQQFRTVCRACTTPRRWKSKFECCCWVYETAS